MELVGLNKVEQKDRSAISDGADISLIGRVSLAGHAIRDDSSDVVERLFTRRDLKNLDILSQDDVADQLSGLFSRRDLDNLAIIENPNNACEFVVWTDKPTAWSPPIYT